MEGVISRAGILKGLLDILPYRQHATADNLLTQSPDPTTAPIRQQLKININHLSTYRLSWSIDPHLIQICRRDRKSISTVTNIDLYRICTIHQSDQYNLSQKKELKHWKYVVAKIKKQAQQQWDLSKQNMDKQKLDTITNALPTQGLNPWTCLSFQTISPIDCTVAVLNKELQQDVKNSPQMVDRLYNERAVRFEPMFMQTECRLRDMRQVAANQTSIEIESEPQSHSHIAKHAQNDHEFPRDIKEQNMEPSDDANKQDIGHTEQKRVKKAISIDHPDLSRITTESNQLIAVQNTHQSPASILEIELRSDFGIGGSRNQQRWARNHVNRSNLKKFIDSLMISKCRTMMMK